MYRYIQCIYGIFGREITTYTVIYGVYIQYIRLISVYTVCIQYIRLYTGFYVQLFPFGHHVCSLHYAALQFPLHTQNATKRKKHLPFSCAELRSTGEGNSSDFHPLTHRSAEQSVLVLDLVGLCMYLVWAGPSLCHPLVWVCCVKSLTFTL